LAIDKALTLSESLEKIWVDGDLKQRQKLQNLVFPSGLGYDKSNDRVRTPKVNAIFGSIPILSKEISNIKKGEPIPVNQFSDLVTKVHALLYMFAKPITAVGFLMPCLCQPAFWKGLVIKLYCILL